MEPSSLQLVSETEPPPPAKTGRFQILRHLKSLLPFKFLRKSFCGSIADEDKGADVYLLSYKGGSSEDFRKNHHRNFYKYSEYFPTLQKHKLELLNVNERTFIKELLSFQHLLLKLEDPSSGPQEAASMDDNSQAVVQYVENLVHVFVQNIISVLRNPEDGSGVTPSNTPVEEEAAGDSSNNLKREKDIICECQVGNSSGAAVPVLLDVQQPVDNDVQNQQV